MKNAKRMLLLSRCRIPGPRSLHKIVEDIDVTIRHTSPPESRCSVKSRAGRRFGKRGRTLVELHYRFPELARISAGNQVAVLTLSHYIGDSLEPRSDHRQSAQACLENHQPESLHVSRHLNVRHYEQIRSVIESLELGIADRTQKSDTI